MFEELWIIKESLCLYHKSWSQTPIDVDTSLFGGFFSAFHSFQETIFPDQYTNFFDFIDHRLLFVKLNTNFFLIVRDSIHKPLNRSILQLNNISIEFLSQIESQEDIKKAFFSDKNKFYSLDELSPIIEPIITSAIENLLSSEEQMNKFDIMAIIIILRDLKDILLDIYHIELFSKFQSSYNFNWILQEIFSLQPINIDTFPHISYNIIYTFINDFFEAIIRHKTFYKKTLRTTDKLAYSNNLLKFISANRENMKKFGIVDLFMNKFLTNITSDL